MEAVGEGGDTTDQSGWEVAFRLSMEEGGGFESLGHASDAM